MKKNAGTLLMFLFAVPALYLRCNSLHDSPLAGGSGAGNPGGTVSVALSIINDTTLVKTDSATGTVANATDSVHTPVTVRDAAGLPVTITGAQINSSGLWLVLDDREDSRHVLDSLRDRPSYLSSDSQGLVINKQFSFDCLNGTPDSTVPPVTMPVARYTGVMLNFNQYPDTGNETEWKSKIQITGSFVYYGMTKKFKVEIDRTFSPFYRFAGGIFTLSSTDTTHLELRFNSSLWFKRVNFKQALDLGQLAFNQRGELVISSYSALQSALDIEFRINTDVINSGKLAVY